MAAYAALVSLTNIIDQIENHPHPPISLDKEQVESLSEKITFLQDFLETYNFHGGNQEVELLQRRIRDAAYAVEDVIESHIVDQILARSTSTHDEDNGSSAEFYQDLQKAIEDIDFIKKDIKKDAMVTKDEMGIIQLQRITTTSAVSSKSSSKEQKTMVGFDDVLIEVLDKLTGQQCNRQIIPIVGMGGIGKTMLARNVFENSLIVQHFDVRYWVTISQEYSVKKILLEIFHQRTQEKKETLSEMSEMNEEELGLQLHKSLSGRRYLIIMDDMWIIDAWNKVKFYFPDNNNGSRIIITTRLSTLALDLVGTNGLVMSFLDEQKSWNLLCKSVFGGKGCPLELKEIGMKIAQNCKGLPLSIVVIGGLLAKSKLTIEYWEHIAENLNSIVNLEENERCLKILQTSYDQLPVHLKPCFLYMGTFPEDNRIYVSTLIKQWVAEGFLKPIRAKSLEEAAEEYLMDLIDRNLILVSEHGASGKIKFCNVHDLLRDLCLREAWKEKFIWIPSMCGLNISHDECIKFQRRITVHESTFKEEYFHNLKSASSTRSLICSFPVELPFLEFRLLTVMKMGYNYLRDEPIRKLSLEAIFRLFNLRYLECRDLNRTRIFPSSVYLVWNLQTLIVEDYYTRSLAPPEIWKMPHLRHVKFPYTPLSDPPISQMDGQDDIVMRNLQTLKGILDLRFGDEVVKRIPNVKKLSIYYMKLKSGHEVASQYCLYNLGRLHKLESLSFYYFYGTPSRSDLLQNLIFPHALKKLTLHRTFLNWEDMSTKIGVLPLLQVLKLKMWAFSGPKWETVEGQFLSLKYLLISSCRGPNYWITDITHFPCLEQLVLRRVSDFEGIPLVIGEIPTLQSIHVDRCYDSVVISAKQILEEQEELGNEGLKVRVILSDKNDQLQSLASHNFHVAVESDDDD